MFDVSVVITTYNAEDTVNRAVFSLLNKPYSDKVEIIIVDDCSKDKTPEIIKSLADVNSNIKYHLLDKNTGGPSAPRNIGMAMATGEFITFLDDDDVSNILGIRSMVQYARKNKLDFVKGYLKVLDTSGIKIVDRLYEIEDLSNKKIIETFIAKQSTRIDFLVKNSFLKKHDIRFNTNIKIGEDTIFYSEIFKNNPVVGYYDTYTQIHNKKINISNLSSTQRYQDKEILDHLFVWKTVERNLQLIGSSYFDLRLSTAVRNSITSIICFSRGNISKTVFKALSDFLNQNKRYLKKIYMTDRYMQVLNALYEGNYDGFLSMSKKRLLIAGYDLKFILPVVPYLEKDYVVLIDEWTGHDIHNERKSKELLQQADIIWCEWLLGNAVWYSNNKMRHQKMVIRAHRFEITREFGYQVDYNNVDKVLAVGYYYLEEFQRKFDIPRNKMQLLSNYVESNIYTGEKIDGYKYTIGLVGSVPKLKGFYRALEILNVLHNKDRRFNLLVVGKKANEFSWVMNNPTEREYYEACEKYIIENDLVECIKYAGFLPREKVFENIGYVLSVSDLESFHLAVAEGYCANSVGFAMPWDGVEYIYPAKIIYQTTSEIADVIFELSVNETKYNELSYEMKKLIMANYDISVFYDNTINILEAL